MKRVLLIDQDAEFCHDFAMSCLQAGIAVRMAENLCEGVRAMLHVPVSVVLVESRLLRLAAPDQARLFDAVAPGVPVVVMVPVDASTEHRVQFEVQGLVVVSKSLDVTELLAKVEALTMPRSWSAAAAMQAGSLDG
jgi:DNA-binding response OmpR family regulator